jgi:hypothetical protein
LIRPDNPPALVRRVTRNVLSSVQQPADEVLCRNVQNFSVRYFDGTNWQTDWDSTALGDVLPYAVEVTLNIADRQITRIVPLACAKPAVPAGG